jgi:REP element-mobilizing transposase RayT
MKQIEFGFFKNLKVPAFFGGEHIQGKRKSKRPLSTKLPIHLVLRASRSKVFRPGNQSLEKLIYRVAKESGIKIYEMALNWSHIHFVIKIHSRESYVKFVRVLNSKLALAVLKSSNAANSEKLFALRPFTRILKWGRDFRNALGYLGLNLFEAAGWIRREKKQVTWRKPRMSQKLQSEYLAPE